MADNTTKNVTIAKNSIFLFARTFISIIVTIFTSRVFLNQLGIEDYGIYNLVGGVVAIFSVLTSFMTGATQRFLSVEIGKGDTDGMNKILNISITLHLILGLILLVVGEIVGIIMLTCFLNIPEGKEFVTQIVFHFALITSVVTLLRTPYAGLIIAKERMSFFAYLSIIEVVLKLIITLSLVFFSTKLIAYSILFLLTTSIITYIHYYYCRKHLSAPTYNYYRPKGNPEYKEMLSFSGWSFLGYTASTMREQGGSFLLNVYFGVLLNAAMGVVNQATGVFSTLFINLQSAFRPQIIQCSVNDRPRYDRLTNVCTFYTILLMGLICTPMVVGCNSILTLWLGIVPDYAVLFVQLMMLKVFFASISQCMSIGLEAFADIKSSMIASAIIAVGCFGFTWLFFHMNLSPSWAISFLVLSELAFLIYRALYSNRKGYIDLMDIIRYNWKAFVFVLLIIVVSFYLATLPQTHVQSILLMAIVVILYSTIALLLMEKRQRQTILNKIVSLIKH